MSKSLKTKEDKPPLLAHVLYWFLEIVFFALTAYGVFISYRVFLLLIIPPESWAGAFQTTAYTVGIIAYSFLILLAYLLKVALGAVLKEKK